MIHLKGTIDPEDRETIRAGMEGWVMKGELPDGSDLGEPPEKIIRRKPPRIVSRPRNSVEEAEKWKRVVAQNIASLSVVAPLLAEYRGLSVEVFDWLIRAGYVALCHGPWPSLSPKARKKEFWDLRIAFPVTRKTEVGGVDFYGIHARWGAGDGRGGWA